jgi:hypothetical protein
MTVLRGALVVGFSQVRLRCATAGFDEVGETAKSVVLTTLAA